MAWSTVVLHIYIDPRYIHIHFLWARLWLCANMYELARSALASTQSHEISWNRCTPLQRPYTHTRNWMVRFFSFWSVHSLLAIFFSFLLCAKWPQVATIGIEWKMYKTICVSELFAVCLCLTFIRINDDFFSSSFFSNLCGHEDNAAKTCCSRLWYLCQKKYYELYFMFAA